MVPRFQCYFCEFWLYRPDRKMNPNINFSLWFMVNSYKNDNSEILTLSDKKMAGDGVQGRLLPIISL